MQMRATSLDEVGSGVNLYINAFFNLELQRHLRECSLTTATADFGVDFPKNGLEFFRLKLPDMGPLATDPKFRELMQGGAKFKDSRNKVAWNEGS